MLEEWYKNLTCEEAIGGLEDEMRNIKKGFVAAGFYMKYIRDNRFYIEAGYESIWEFADTVYGISKSTASRWMAINDKFSKDGNSPFLEEQFEKFEKSQLQEMLYLNDKQLEQVTPEMTTKEIREIRKEEKKLLKPDENQVEYLKAAAKHLIRSNHEWFAEKYHERVLDVTTSPTEMKNKFVPNKATWYFATKTGTGHINLFKEYVQVWGEQGKNIGDFEWFYFARSIQVMWNAVAEEKAEEERKRKEQEAVCNHSVNTESEPVATSQQEKNPGQMEVYDYPELIPEEMQQEIIEAEYKEVEEKPKRVTTILTYLVEAVMEEYDIEEILLDVAEEDKNDSIYDNLFGETIAFTFCNTEMLGEFLSEIEIYNRGTLFKSYSWQQFFEEFEYVTSVKERTNQESVPEEEEQEEDVWTDLQLLQEMVNEENKLLNDILGCYSEKDVLTRKQKIKATALAALLCDWDTIEPEPPEPPELPQLKNNDQRKKFLETYETWPIWFEVPQASEVYHRFDLPDGSSIVVCEYYQYCEWKKRYGENPKTTYHKEYLLKPGYKYLHDCGTNQTALVEHLKNLQKGEK